MYKGFIAVSLVLGIASIVIGIVSLVHVDWLKFCFLQNLNPLNAGIDFLNSLSPDIQIDAASESPESTACIRRGLIQIAGGVTVGTEDRVILIPARFLTVQEKATLALIVVGLILLLPGIISVMVGTCCVCNGKKGKKSATLAGFIFFMIAGVSIFTGSIVYTAKQADLLADPVQYFLTYSSIIENINSLENSNGNNNLGGEFFPDLFGNTNSSNEGFDITSLLGGNTFSNFGADSSNNSGGVPENILSFFGGAATNNLNSETPDFQNGLSIFSADNILGANGSSSLDSETSTTSTQTTTNTIVDLQISGEEPVADVSISETDKSLTTNETIFNVEEELQEVIKSLSAYEQALQDFPFLGEATLVYGTSYILGWVCAFTAVLAALMAVLARSQISDYNNEKDEEEEGEEEEEEKVPDYDSEKKEDFNA